MCRRPVFESPSTASRATSDSRPPAVEGDLPDVRRATSAAPLTISVRLAQLALQRGAGLCGNIALHAGPLGAAATLLSRTQHARLSDRAWRGTGPWRDWRATAAARLRFTRHRLVQRLFAACAEQARFLGVRRRSPPPRWAAVCPSRSRASRETSAPTRPAIGSSPVDPPAHQQCSSHVDADRSEHAITIRLVEPLNAPSTCCCGTPRCPAST